MENQENVDFANDSWGDFAVGHDSEFLLKSPGLKAGVKLRGPDDAPADRLLMASPGHGTVLSDWLQHRGRERILEDDLKVKGHHLQHHQHVSWEKIVDSTSSVAARIYDGLPGMRSRVARVRSFVRDRDLIFSVLMVLLGAFFFHRVRDLIYFMFYTGYPLVRSYVLIDRVVGAKEVNARDASLLKNHVCFWGLSSCVQAILSLFTRSAVYFDREESSWGIFALLSLLVQYAGHIFLNAILWWRPVGDGQLMGDEFCGALWMWKNILKRHIAPELRRSWNTLYAQLVGKIGQA